MARMRTEAEQQQLRQLGTRPGFPVAAAGRAFADRGAAIAAMLQNVHDAGATRIENLRAVTDAAAEQMRVYGDVDKHFGGELS
ncbi:hypothetical protein [Corynebacterium sp.]|uniref:hypothetical protein n=1 Tax=Corynebacterium sp. TaxID=1720 RepID=UPI0026DEF0DA|nr:hypothetical protein [Corynebacterium sp.]MDO5513206.1 hypothetical protein [Corynebacterium sp.]